jgi:hypothetical protein
MSGRVSALSMLGCLSGVLRGFCFLFDDKIDYVDPRFKRLCKYQRYPYPPNEDLYFANQVNAATTYPSSPTLNVG